MVAVPMLANAAEMTLVEQQRTQVPGYYRMMLGDVEVTALYDGVFTMDPALLKGASADDIQSLIARMFQASTPGVQTAVNAFLVHTGKNLILVDTGSQACFGPTLGNVSKNLAVSGYSPEQVDTVLLTHLHPDHACGLLAADGSAAYPNATVIVPKGEEAYWLSKELMAVAPEGAQPFFKMAMAAVAPYQASGHFKTFSQGESPIEGVEAVPTYGHTPGHTGYMIGTEQHSLMLWGDIVHNYASQFVRPEIAIEFDSDSEQAIETRKKVFAQAADDKLWVGGAHMPFPGIGHVRKEDVGYSWVPVEYAPITAPAE